MKRIFVFAAAAAISLLFSYHQASASDMAQKVISVCNEEIGFVVLSARQAIEEKYFYAVPEWRTKTAEKSMALQIALRHNIGFLNGGSYKDGEQTRYGILYAKYYPKHGWVWYANSSLDRLPASSDELARELVYIGQRRPFGIISSDREPQQSIAIRLLCRKFIKENLLNARITSAGE